MNSNRHTVLRRSINFLEADEGTRSAEKVCVRQAEGGELEHQREGPERPLPLTRAEAEEWVKDLIHLREEEREFWVKCLCGEDWPGNY